MNVKKDGNHNPIFLPNSFGMFWPYIIIHFGHGSLACLEPLDQEKRCYMLAQPLGFAEIRICILLDGSFIQWVGGGGVEGVHSNVRCRVSLHIAFFYCNTMLRG